MDNDEASFNRDGRGKVEQGHEVNSVEEINPAESRR